MKPAQQIDVIQRLHCAAGHLKAIIEMAETGQSCRVAEVLHQLNAVQSALRAAGVRLIRCQAEASQDVILNSLSPYERMAELKRLQSLYMIFVQHFKHSFEVSND